MLLGLLRVRLNKNFTLSLVENNIDKLFGSMKIL